MDKKIVRAVYKHLQDKGIKSTIGATAATSYAKGAMYISNGMNRGPYVIFMEDDITLAHNGKSVNQERIILWADPKMIDKIEKWLQT